MTPPPPQGGGNGFVFSLTNWHKGKVRSMSVYLFVLQIISLPSGGGGEFSPWA